ncbi:MAG: PA2169 family four-helix-bundle protein [Pseudomonadota bacterium]|jgi:uncharacterized protein (TIGR02284 family)|nr:PA2169 family four-helix-bundle protein [Pseudomonadota bacterium]
MSNPNVDVLNDVTKTLIDSHKGYQKVSDLADSSYALRSKFISLAAERQDLIAAFQQRVRDYGEEPVTSGGVGGTLHRAWADFTALFQKDEKASLEAVDDGEEHLGDQVESKLDTAGLDAGTVDLLRRALASARRGESFADALTDH